MFVTPLGELFQHLDFDTQQLHQLWYDIQDLSTKHPALWNYKIVKELDQSKYDWGERYLLKRILPELRATLKDHEIISVETDTPAGSDNDRQVWVIQ